MTKKITLLLLMITFSSLSVLAQNTVNDISLLEAKLKGYSLPNKNNTLVVNVKNNGNTPIKSLKLTWTDGIKKHTALIKTHIPVGASKRLSHPKPVNYSKIVEKNIQIYLEQDGVDDFNTSDNTTTVSFNTVSKKGTKGVLYEKGTASWCRGCPLGISAFEHMDKKNLKSFIGIAIHAKTDPMGFEEYVSKLGFRTIPSYNLDRTSMDKKFPNATCLEEPHEKRKNLEVPADLFIKTTESGNKINITASAEFYTNTSSGYRLGVIIVENKVTGTGKKYNQVNGCSGKDVDCGRFNDLPDPVPASQMEYNHVARALLGGYDGQAGSVPPQITNGQTSKYTFTYEVPTGIKRENLVFVAVLIRSTSGAVVNAKKQPYKGGLSTNEQEVASMYVYPNPVSNSINISFDAAESAYEVAIYDMAGRAVYKKNFSNLNGKQFLTVPADKISAGNYIVSLAGKTSSFSKHIIVR